MPASKELSLSIELSKQKVISHTIPIGFLVIWSGGAVFAKVGLNYTTPWSFLLLRSAIALTLLLAIFLAKPKTRQNIDSSKPIQTLTMIDKRTMRAALKARFCMWRL